MESLNAIQRDALVVISGAESGLTTREVADEVAGYRDKPYLNMSDPLQELESRGLVENQRAGVANSYSLTMKGAEVLETHLKWRDSLVK